MEQKNYKYSNVSKNELQKKYKICYAFNRGIAIIEIPIYNLYFDMRGFRRHI